MSKRLILHIGAEKTATTYIQNYFSVNREAYRNTGVLYPKTSFGEHAQFSLIAALHEIDHGFGLEFAPQGKEYTIESEWKPLIERLNKQTRFHTVILSVEHFSSRLKEKGLEKLSEILTLLDGYEIEVIYYFRRQDDYFQSWYSTHIKAGGFKTLEQALSDSLKNPWFFDTNFLLKKWKEAIPSAKYHVRPYDYVSKNIGMIEDMVDQLNLPILDKELRPELDRNESWSPNMLAVARHINEFYIEKLTDKRYQVLEFISKYMIGGPTVKNLLPSEVKNNILEKFESNNRLLCSEYEIDYELIFSRALDEEFINPDHIKIDSINIAEILIIAIKNSI